MLVVLLLQLGMGSAWAAVRPQAEAASHAVPSAQTQHAPSCHGQAQTTTDQASNALSLHAQQGDSHHCCAVGLGVGVQPALPALPHAPPSGARPLGLSLQQPPDLRPPI